MAVQRNGHRQVSEYLMGIVQAVVPKSNKVVVALGHALDAAARVLAGFEYFVEIFRLLQIARKGVGVDRT